MTASPSSLPSVRFRLRDATAEAHRELEATMALAGRCADRASYRALLADLFGIYAPLEAALAAVEWDGLGIDFAARTKSQWLHADLMALGLSSLDIAALPRTTRLPTIQSPSDGFGVLYVLEGASLGGQFIIRQIPRALGLTETAGVRFFASYGADVGEHWRSFIAAMALYGASEERAEAMERAALVTFEHFLFWMNERPPRITEGAAHVL